eukprot:Skav211752  [mRNA]  locus=scaffold1548:659930:672993:- [translate_table: standard]
MVLVCTPYTCSRSPQQKIDGKGRSYPWLFKFARALPLRLCMLLMFVRVGEASHPGPSSRTCVLGTFNPSGLNGKAHLVANNLQYGDLWLISETHLTTRALHMFRTGLRVADSEYKYCIGGYPVPGKAASSFAGSYRGVATLSKWPTRALPVSWSRDAFRSSRVQICTTLLGDMWITSGVDLPSFAGMHPDEAYKLMWQTIEQAALTQHPQNSRAACGRGCRTQPKRVVGVAHAPVKNARLGELQPEFHGTALVHARWFKQLRRLQSYVRAVQTRPTNALDIVSLWGAICRSKGFHHGFPEWYASCEYRVVGAPVELPLCPPVHDLAVLVFQSFQLAVRALEKQLRSQRSQHAKERHVNNPNMIFKDIKQPGLGTVDLLMQPTQATVLEELQFRAEQMWPLVVGCSVAHRHHFAEFHRVDPVETRAWLQLLSKDDAGSFRTLLNGTFFTSDSAKHWNDGYTCRFCDCSDGRFHRFWQCGLFDEQRQQIPPDIWELIPDLPETLTCLGWSLRPATMDTWLRMLAQIPHYDIRRAVLLASEGINRIYTDGSCFHQHDRVIRHAAWASVLDTGSGFQIVAQGVLPGVLQSAFRAELYAVMIVLEVAAVNHAAVHIFSDNRAVVKGIQRLQRGGQDRAIEHVRAHQDRHGGHLDCHGRANSFADRTAVRANLNRNSDFWDLHKQHVQQVHWCRRVSRVIQQALLSVSREVFKTEMVSQCEELPPSDATPCQAKPVPSVGCRHTEGELPFKIRAAYGDAFIGRVAAWLGAVRTELESCEEGLPRWVSTFQLYVDFQKACGRGPIRVDGRSLAVDLSNLLTAAPTLANSNCGNGWLSGPAQDMLGTSRGGYIQDDVMQLSQFDYLRRAVEALMSGAALALQVASFAALAEFHCEMKFSPQTAVVSVIDAVQDAVNGVLVKLRLALPAPSGQDAATPLRRCLAERDAEDRLPQVPLRWGWSEASTDLIVTTVPLLSLDFCGRLFNVTARELLAVTPYAGDVPFTSPTELFATSGEQRHVRVDLAKGAGLRGCGSSKLQAECFDHGRSRVKA